MRAVNFFDSPTGMGTSQHRPAPAGAQQQQHSSTWRSPVPYLFGGLAAMMGLIAFALLLLACSYWRLSGYLEEGGGGGDGAAGDLESDGKPDDAGAARLAPLPPEQRIVVIMAGDEKPTFLATPASSRASSFGDNASRAARAIAGGEEDNKPDQAEENRPETAAGRGRDHVSEPQTEGTPESQEAAHQSHDLEGVLLHENL